jgi:amidase
VSLTTRQLVGKATNLVRKLRDSYYAALDKYDVLVLPTLPFLAPKLPAENASVAELMINSAGVSLNTSAFNLVSTSRVHNPLSLFPVRSLTHPLCISSYNCDSTEIHLDHLVHVVPSSPAETSQTGMPALSFPVGFLPHPQDESARLPVGMQIVGKFYAEPTIYRVAYAWEQANDWKTFA